MTPVAALDRFFDAYYRRRPVTATFTGVHAYDAELPDWSPEGLASAVVEMRSLRRMLDEAGRLPDTEAYGFPDQIDLALADAFLEIQIAEHEGAHFYRRNPALWTGEAIFSVISPHCLAVRWSHHNSAGRKTSSFSSSSTEPCIWPEKLTAAISSAFTPSADKTWRIAALDARHQSPGDCSAQPIRGDANGSCSTVAEAKICPVSSITIAREPPVPMSNPKSFTLKTEPAVFQWNIIILALYLVRVAR